MKPKAQVKSAWILPKQKQALMSVMLKKEYCGHMIIYSCVIYIDIDLNLHVTKGYWHFVCEGCNLIHDNICQVNDCRTIPHYLIILSFFDDDTLSGMTKAW
jgi:hypothetical protein